MKKHLLFFMFLLISSAPFSAEPSTSLAIQDINNNLYHGRTLELTTDLPSWITYYPEKALLNK